MEEKHAIDNSRYKLDTKKIDSTFDLIRGNMLKKNCVDNTGLKVQHGFGSASAPLPGTARNAYQAPTPGGYAPQGYAPPPSQGYAPPSQGYAPPPERGGAPPPPAPYAMFEYDDDDYAPPGGAAVTRATKPKDTK